MPETELFINKNVIMINMKKKIYYKSPFQKIFENDVSKETGL